MDLVLLVGQGQSLDTGEVHMKARRLIGFIYELVFIYIYSSLFSLKKTIFDVLGFQYTV